MLSFLISLKGSDGGVKVTPEDLWPEALGRFTETQANKPVQVRRKMMKILMCFMGFVFSSAVSVIYRINDEWY